MIARVKLRLSCERSGRLPQAHGMFLVDWARAAIGDDGPLNVDAWSVRPMQPEGGIGAAGLLAFDAGCDYDASIVCLDSHVAGALVESATSERVEWGDTTFALHVDVRERAEPMEWYEAALDGAEARRAFIRWSTPTAFSVDGRVPPLPHPGSVFEYWIRKWDATMPVTFGDDGCAMLASEIRARPTIVRGTWWRDGRGSLPAFTGGAVLAVSRNADRLTGVAFSTLAHYAEFAGTGLRTHHGMGVTDVEFA
jgi:CRISPR-associated endoribonuclease Cas6